MTQSALPNNDSTSVSIRTGSSSMKSLDAEVIRALTPLFIAGIGGLIAIFVLFLASGKDDTAKFAAGLGLAGTAITGAAGLAQPGKGSEKQQTVLDVEKQK